MAEFPALPLWTDALVGDTYHLTPAEFGAYMRLLVTAWRSPGCALPNDDALLGRYVGDPKNWHRLRGVVMAFFTVGEDGLLRQKRLSDERNFVARQAAKSSAGGRAKALKRLNRGSAQSLPNLCLTPAPTPTPTPKKESKTQRVSKPKEPTPIESPPEGFEEFWKACVRKHDRDEAVVEFRNAVASGVTPAMLTSQIAAYYRHVEKLKTKIEYQLGPKSWLRKRKWTDEYEPPELSQAERERIFAEQFLPGWTRGRYWPDEHLGPEPGKPGCRIPPDLLAKYGLLPPLAVVSG